jgi:uncharacterized membrane protein YkoI
MTCYKKLSLLAFALTAVGTVAIAADVNNAASTGHSLIQNAKISMVDARAIALKAHPGKITDEELEKEKGGSGLRYSFDIKDAKGTQEVGVDAKTGIVLENKLEGPNPD